ncbi:insulinase family protein [bacterium]|nr:insulinase family protein [bacterium]
MAVVISPDNSMSNVSIQALVKSAPLFEGDLLGTGVSHLVEHLVFECPESVVYQDAGKEIRRLGGNINAYTSFDKTVFYIDMIGNNYDKALSVLYNSLFKSEIKKEVFANEKAVVYQEIKNREDDITYRLTNKIFSMIFTNHPYSIPLSGYKDVLKNLSYNDTVNYYKRTYSPNNIILVIAGNVNIDDVKKKVTDIFEKEPQGRVVFKPNTSMIENFEKRVDISTAKDAQLCSVYYGFKGNSVFDKESVVLDVISAMLGMGKNSLLYKNLKLDNNIVLNISCENYSMYDSGILNISVSCIPENKEIMEQQVFNIISKIKKGRFKSKYLCNAKNMIKSDYIFSQETLSGRAEILGVSEFYFNNADYPKRYIELIDNITKQDVVRVANKYLNENNLSKVVFLPVGSKETIGNVSAVENLDKKLMEVDK